MHDAPLGEHDPLPRAQRALPGPGARPDHPLFRRERGRRERTRGKREAAGAGAAAGADAA